MMPVGQRGAERVESENEALVVMARQKIKLSGTAQNSVNLFRHHQIRQTAKF